MEKDTVSKELFNLVVQAFQKTIVMYADNILLTRSCYAHILSMLDNLNEEEIAKMGDVELLLSRLELIDDINCAQEELIEKYFMDQEEMLGFPMVEQVLGKATR